MHCLSDEKEMYNLVVQSQHRLPHQPSWVESQLHVFCSQLFTSLTCKIRIMKILPLPLLSLYPREIKTFTYTKTWTGMFMAALLTKARNWKQPKCPSVGGWINKLRSSHIMEYYSAIQRNEVWYMLQRGWTSNTLSQVKEARHTR